MKKKEKTHTYLHTNTYLTYPPLSAIYTSIPKHTWPTHLYLLYVQVQEGELVADTDGALGPCATHAGSQTTIQLDDHQFGQQVLGLLFAWRRQAAIGFDLDPWHGFIVKSY